MPIPIDRRALLKLTSKAALCLTSVAGVSNLTRPVLAGEKTASEFFTEIAPGVFVHRGLHASAMTAENLGNVANCGFVVGDDAIAVIDTCGSAKFGDKIKTAIAQITDRPIRYVINTHMHPDHVFGNAAFVAENTVFVGHHKLARGLSAREQTYMSANKRTMGEAAFAGTKIVLPTKPVKDTQRLDLGGRTLTLTAHKTAHTDNDLTVRDDKTDSVFMGDLIFSEHTPTIDGSAKGWNSLLMDMSKKPMTRIVPGHGPVTMGWPGAAQPVERYLSKLISEIRAVIARDGTLQEAVSSVGQSEKSAWELFEHYHKRNVSAAFAELEWE